MQAKPGKLKAIYQAMLVATAFTFSVQQVALGQEENTEEKKPERATNRLIEEVVVVAQKRTENAQDVPIALAAFSNEKLDAMGIDDPKDLAQFTPGMYYGQTVNFAVIYIRGVGSDAFLPDSDPSIATYIDGIYYPFANGQSQAFGAVERIEVLKGPQGTLFGRNSTGGAINIISKSPGYEPEISIQYSDADFNDVNKRLYVNLPFFQDMFGLSVSYTKRDNDNYYKGTIGDGNGGQTPLFEEEAEGFRYKFRFSPTEDIDLTLARIDYEQYGIGSTAMPNVAPSTLLQLQGGEATTEPYRVDVDVATYFSLDNKVDYGQFDWRMNWFDIKVLGSKQEITTDNVYDFDGTTAPFITFDAKGQFADVKTQELQIISNDSMPAWLEWIAGYYHIEQTAGFPLNRVGVAGLDTIAAYNLPAPLLGPFNQLTSLVGAPTGSVAMISLQSAESDAYFAQTTVRLFDDFLALTVGGRYQEEERTVDDSSSYLMNADGSQTFIQRYQGISNQENNFSPRYNVALQFTDDIMAYATYTKGYKSGTFNTVNIYDAPEFVEPEVVETVELGLKSQFFDGGLTVNAAIFRNNIDNLQVQFISLLSGGAVSLENAGEAEIQGFDFDVQWVPMPSMNPGLVVAASGAYLDSEYLKYENGSGYDEENGLYNGGTGDFSGNKVTRTPEWSGSVGLNQIVNLWDFGELEFNTSLYYNDGFYFTASNKDLSWEDSYEVWDATISFLHYDSNIRLSFFGKNLTEAEYNYSQFHTDSGRQDYLAPPKTFGLRINWDWAADEAWF